ncbi:MAG: endonuclease III domain-containing protein [Elusimicrobiota bacterium]
MSPPSLKIIYNKLFKAFGPQYWWPAKNAFEVIIGAVLTQNTNWSNVEKALSNLKGEIKLTPKALYALDKTHLANLIRSSGYYNQKAERLHSFCCALKKDYKFNLNSMLSSDIHFLRKKLLSIKGIGPETADSIILYAANKPIFVVDAYTFRMCGRLGFDIPRDYEKVQVLFHKKLPNDSKLFNEFHALIVRLAKNYCKKKPVCYGCPIRINCKYYIERPEKIKI